MRAENKETVINERGRTEDIISCVVDTYNLYWRKCEHTAKKLQSSNVLLTCSNIIDFVLDNIRYELDPEGKQWVKTPARLLEDGKGDCKSYSILVCSFLSCLGIRNCFRFVSYHKGDYTHVYSVAFDEDGKEIVIDCVAMQTANVKRFAEVKYRKKLDVMNTTEISRLSGIGGGYNPTFAKVLANSCLIKAQAIGDYIETAMYLNWIVDNVKSEEELRICAYTFGLWCYGFVTDMKDSTKAMGFDTLCVLTQDFFVGLTNPAAPQPQPYSYEEQQKSYDWFVANIIDNWKVLQNPDPTATKENYFQPLYECAPMFLYLFAPAKSLNAKTKKKRDNAVKIVTALCAGRAITLEAAMNAIYAAIVKQFGMTPSEVLHTLFPKQYQDYIKLDKARVVSAIGAAKYEFDEIAPPSDNVTQLPPDYYESTPAQKVSIIEKILGGVVGAFTKVWGAVTGQTGSAQVYYQNTTPSQNDYSGMISTVAIAVLAVGAFFVFKNKKKKR